MDARQRLLEALKAIASAQPPIAYETAFHFLAHYVPGSDGGADGELRDAFNAAIAAIDAA